MAWKVVEVVDGKSKLKKRGSEEVARKAFECVCEDGTEGHIVLVDPNGGIQDRFGAINLEIDEGTITDKPLQEIEVKSLLDRCGSTPLPKPTYEFYPIWQTVDGLLSRNKDSFGKAQQISELAKTYDIDLMTLIGVIDGRLPITEEIAKAFFEEFKDHGPSTVEGWIAIQIEKQ